MWLSRLYIKYQATSRSGLTYLKDSRGRLSVYSPSSETKLTACCLRDRSVIVIKPEHERSRPRKVVKYSMTVSACHMCEPVIVGNDWWSHEVSGIFFLFFFCWDTCQQNERRFVTISRHPPTKDQVSSITNYTPLQQLPLIGFRYMYLNKYWNHTVSIETC